MRENVHIALCLSTLGEPPVSLGGSGVVVLDEGHRTGRPPAEHAGWLTVLVGEPPVLTALEHGMEDTLGGDVKGTREATRVVDPLDDPLPVRILVVLGGVVIVLEGVPKLTHREAHVGGFHVGLDMLAGEAAHVVEPPPVVANLRLKPLHPLGDVALDEILGVIDVWRGVEKVSAALVALPAEVGIVGDDGARVPVKLAAVLVPEPVGSLELGAPVIEDGVTKALDAVPVQSLDALLKLLLGAVLAVQVVQVPWHVTLLGDRIRGGREPHHGEAKLGKSGRHLRHLAVPRAATFDAGGLPVETLQEHLLAGASRGLDPLGGVDGNHRGDNRGLGLKLGNHRLRKGARGLRDLNRVRHHDRSRRIGEPRGLVRGPLDGGVQGGALHLLEGFHAFLQLALNLCQPAVALLHGSGHVILDGLFNLSLQRSLSLGLRIGSSLRRLGSLSLKFRDELGLNLSLGLGLKPPLLSLDHLLLSLLPALLQELPRRSLSLSRPRLSLLGHRELHLIAPALEGILGDLDVRPGPGLLCHLLNLVSLLDQVGRGGGAAEVVEGCILRSLCADGRSLGGTRGDGSALGSGVRLSDEPPGLCAGAGILGQILCRGGGLLGNLPRNLGSLHGDGGLLDRLLDGRVDVGLQTAEGGGGCSSEGHLRGLHGGTSRTRGRVLGGARGGNLRVAANVASQGGGDSLLGQGHDEIGAVVVEPAIATAGLLDDEAETARSGAKVHLAVRKVTCESPANLLQGGLNRAVAVHLGTLRAHWGRGNGPHIGARAAGHDTPVKEKVPREVRLDPDPCRGSRGHASLNVNLDSNSCHLVNLGEHALGEVEERLPGSSLERLGGRGGFQLSDNLRLSGFLLLCTLGLGHE